jgi:hypothetical protein
MENGEVKINILNGIYKYEYEFYDSNGNKTADTDTENKG